jgi:hypothetical protein
MVEPALLSGLCICHEGSPSLWLCRCLSRSWSVSSKAEAPKVCSCSRFVRRHLSEVDVSPLLAGGPTPTLAGTLRDTCTRLLTKASDGFPMLLLVAR